MTSLPAAASGTDPSNWIFTANRLHGDAGWILAAMAGAAAPPDDREACLLTDATAVLLDQLYRLSVVIGQHHRGHLTPADLDAFRLAVRHLARRPGRLPPRPHRITGHRCTPAGHPSPHRAARPPPSLPVSRDFPHWWA